MSSLAPKSQFVLSIVAAPMFAAVGVNRIEQGKLFWAAAFLAISFGHIVLALSAARASAKEKSDRNAQKTTK